MQQIDLMASVNEISATTDGVAGRGERPPFAFIVGAGVSEPHVPLAEAITKQCRADAVYRNTTLVGRTVERPSAAYSYWLEQAHPSPEDRRSYLAKLIRNKPITEANFQLARLLFDGRVARICVTPNFDDLLHRALRMFGQEFLLCDSPGTVHRVNPARADVIQLIHAHGLHWGYDLANLSEEIKSAAEPGNNPHTMRGLLDDVFRDTSPIVIGYAGWDGDVIVAALRDRLRSAYIERRWYWFCHTESDLLHVQSLFKDLPGARQLRIIGPTSGGDGLPAAVVLENLAAGRPVPEAVTSPVDWLHRSLQAASPTGSGMLAKAIAKARRAALLLERDLKGTEESVGGPSEKELAVVDDLLMRRAHEEWDAVIGDRVPLDFPAIIERLHTPNWAEPGLSTVIRSKIRDLRPLAALMDAKKLDLSDTNAYDLAPLAKLISLQALQLDRTRVSSVEVLAGLTALKDLSLSGTFVVDISPLRALIALQTLDLSNTNVVDVAPLAGLAGLRSLNLSRTRVSDVSMLTQPRLRIER